KHLPAPRSTLFPYTTLFRSFLAVVAVTTFSSCSDDDDQDGNSAQLAIYMTDAPGNYDEVWVNVTDVQIKTDVSTTDEGWTSLGRSEEHTSELQSRENLVCRL